MTEICVECKQSFSPQSRPRYVFDDALRFVGLCHAVHAPEWTLTTSLYSLETARFYAWLSRRPYPERNSNEWYAHLLAICAEPCKALTLGQEHMLNWWARPAGLAMSAERRQHIKALYQALVEEYSAAVQGVA